MVKPIGHRFILRCHLFCKFKRKEIINLKVTIDSSLSQTLSHQDLSLENGLTALKTADLPTNLCFLELTATQ